MEEKKVDSKSKLKKIGGVILIVAIGLLLEYIGLVTYRYTILGRIYDNSKQYENIQNIYIEEVKISRNENQQTKVENAKYWYKDGIFKMEVQIQGQVEYKTHIWIDLQQNEGYMLVEKGNDKTGTKLQTKEIFKSVKEGKIIQYLSGSQVNYAENKFLDAMKVMSIHITDTEKYSYVSQENSMFMYDNKTGLLSGKQVSVGNNEYIDNYQYAIGNVKEDDVEKIDITGYEIGE